MNGFLNRAAAQMWMIAELKDEVSEMVMVVEMRPLISSHNTYTPASPTFLFLFCTRLVPAQGFCPSARGTLCSEASVSTSPRGCPFPPFASWLECHFLRHTLTDHPANGPLYHSCYCLMGFVLFWVLITTENLKSLFLLSGPLNGSPRRAGSCLSCSVL